MGICLYIRAKEKMKATYGIIDFEVAQRALQELNRRVAKVFLQEPKPVRFVFLSYIAHPSGKRAVGTCLGMCVREANEIQLRIDTEWKKTAIHELVHLYNAKMTECQVEKATGEVCKYLKYEAGFIPSG